MVFEVLVILFIISMLNLSVANLIGEKQPYFSVYCMIKLEKQKVQSTVKFNQVAPSFRRFPTFHYRTSAITVL